MTLAQRVAEKFGVVDNWLYQGICGALRRCEGPLTRLGWLEAGEHTLVRARYLRDA